MTQSPLTTCLPSYVFTHVPLTCSPTHSTTYLLTYFYRVQEKFTDVNGSAYPWGSQFYKALNHDQCCAQDEAANTATGIVPQQMGWFQF